MALKRMPFPRNSAMTFSTSASAYGEASVANRISEFNQRRNISCTTSHY
ncbi:MAG: hypothetical protein VSS75_008775 [Candidatus Parabeggiatoa sp.]